MLGDPRILRRKAIPTAVIRDYAWANRPWMQMAGWCDAAKRRVKESEVGFLQWKESRKLIDDLGGTTTDVRQGKRTDPDEVSV